MPSKNILEGVKRNFSIKKNFNLFSNEIEKQYRIYKEQTNPSSRLNVLQLFLTFLSVIASIRFFLLSLLLSNNAEEVLYKYDVLFNALDAKRKYDPYITFCMGVFSFFYFYIYYINYFCLNKRLVEAIWITIQQAKKVVNRKLQNRTLSKRKSGKNNSNCIKIFFKYESLINSIMIFLFGKQKTILFNQNVIFFIY